MDFTTESLLLFTVALPLGLAAMPSSFSEMSLAEAANDPMGSEAA